MNSNKLKEVVYIFGLTLHDFKGVISMVGLMIVICILCFMVYNIIHLLKELLKSNIIKKRYILLILISFGSAIGIGLLLNLVDNL